MIAEKLISPPVESAEEAEQQLSADEFSEAYSLTCETVRALLKRHDPQTFSAPFELLVKQGLSEEKLNEAVEFLDSDQARAVLDKFFVQNSRSPAFTDSSLRSYLVSMGLSGAATGLIDGSLNSNKLPRQRVRQFKSLLVTTHHEILKLVDSDFGQQLGFGRKHLKSILRSAYGESSTKDSSLADMAEAGIAVEIATKRYIEELIADGKFPGRRVRYSTSAEDMIGRDIVYQAGDKALLIDVKSSDKNHHGGEPVAGYSRLEPVDANIFKIERMHPAKHTVVDEQFRILANNYRRVIEDALSEFEAAAHLA